MEQFPKPISSLNNTTNRSLRETINEQNDQLLLSEARISNGREADFLADYDKQYEAEVEQVAAASKRALGCWHPPPLSDGAMTQLPSAAFDVEVQVATSPKANLEIRYRPASGGTLFGSPANSASLDAVISVDLQNYPVKSLTLSADAHAETEKAFAEYTRVVCDYALRLTKTKGRERGYLVVNSNFEGEIVEQLALQCGAMDFPKHYLTMLETGSFPTTKRTEKSDSASSEPRVDALQVQAHLEKLFPNVTYAKQFDSWFCGYPDQENPATVLGLCAVIFPLACSHAVIFAGFNTINTNTKAQWARAIADQLEQCHDRGLTIEHCKHIITSLHGAARSDSRVDRIHYRGSARALVETTLFSLKKLTADDMPSFMSAVTSLPKSPADEIERTVRKLLQ